MAGQPEKYFRRHYLKFCPDGRRFLAVIRTDSVHADAVAIEVVWDGDVVPTAKAGRPR